MAAKATNLKLAADTTFIFGRAFVQVKSVIRRQNQVLLEYFENIPI